MTTRVNADTFFSGLLSALAVNGRRSIAITPRRFDSAIAVLAQRLMEKAEAEGLDVEFRVRPHPIHGTSSTVRECLSSAVQADLISLDNPEYQDLRIKITDAEAEKMLEWLPGGRDLYLELAQKFLAEYEPASV